MTRSALTLPNGKPFKMWDDTTVYRRELHVSAEAAEGGDGSAEYPFKTISEAAAVATSGDRVTIHGGVYRETVNPAGSGAAPDNMLCFRGAEGERAVISAAEVLKCEYKPSRGWKKTNWNASAPYSEGSDFADPGAAVYMFRFPRGSFADTNPFGMINASHYAWYLNDAVPAKMYHAKSLDQKRTVVMRRGNLFCDGGRMEQVFSYYELGERKNSFWVEDDGLTVHLRMPDDGDPATHLIEYTAREQCFTPLETGSAYIHLENLTFEKGANGFPPPQRGIVSAYCGHHWLIRGCEINDANGIGIDVGFQCPTRFETGESGGHIVENNVVSRCGISGITASMCSSEKHYLDNRHGDILIRNNRLDGNCWQNFDEIMEEAAIKPHHLIDSIVSGNVITNCPNGIGIWTDASCENIKVSENVIINSRSRECGALFVEASHKDIEISYNVVSGVRSRFDRGGSGIYSHNCDRINNYRNIVFDCEFFGIQHKYGNTQRLNVGCGNTGYGMAFVENIITGCRHALLVPTDKFTQVGGNLYGRNGFPSGGYLKLGFPELHLDLEAWQEYLGFDADTKLADIECRLNGLSLALKLSVFGKDVEADIDLAEPIGAQIDALWEKLKPDNAEKKALK